MTVYQRLAPNFEPLETLYTKIWKITIMNYFCVTYFSQQQYELNLSSFCEPFRKKQFTLNMYLKVQKPAENISGQKCQHFHLIVNC